MLRDLLHIRSEPAAHGVALRAGISVLVPMLTVLALGHPEWTMYAAFGAFTSLYGRNHVHLSRVVMQASAGAALTVAVALGAAVGSLESRDWVAVLAGAAVAALGSSISSTQDWHPPGPLFLVFAFGAVASVPHGVRDIPWSTAVTAASAMFSLFVGNVGALLRSRRSGRERVAPVRTWQPARLAVAVLLAGGFATAAGIGHSYWAMVAAVAPLTVHGAAHQLVRSGHRIVGTLLGLVTSAALLVLGLGPVATVLVVALLQIVTELVVGRNYGLALLFITPMALLMGQLAAPRQVGSLLLDRGVETVIGALVAIGIILLEQKARRCTHLGRIEVRRTR